MNEMAGTFSGGMKRRLSVAISLIGSPLCCYLVNIFALGMISFVGRMHVLKTYLYKNNSRTKTTH
jgi:ABC-type phosphonate transport system ATPase subunit